jgi:hypothetical protein
VVGFDRSPRAVEAHDVITGRHRGRPFLAALFIVDEPVDTSNSGQSSVQVTSVWVRIPVVRPTLDVRQVLRMESRINEGLGLGDIRIGHPEFDARYQVTCADLDIRCDLLDRIPRHVWG